MGCSRGDDNRFHVAGEVQFKGQPIPIGRIVFEPDTRRGNSGSQGFASIEAGRYDTKQFGRAVVAGPAIVTIEGFSQKPGNEADGSAGSLFRQPFRQDVVIPQHDSQLDFRIEGPSR